MIFNDSFFASIALLAAIHFAAMASPGPTSILLLKVGSQKINNEIYFIVTGIILATLTNVILTITGVAALIAATPRLLTILSVIGAIYLVYLGIKSLIAAFKTFTSGKSVDTIPVDLAVANGKQQSAFSLLRSGYIMGIVNPKVVMFYVSVFSRVASPNLPKITLFIFGLQLVMQSLLYWGTFATFARNGKLKNWLDRSKGWADFIFGSALLLFASLMIWDLYKSI